MLKPLNDGNAVDIGDVGGMIVELMVVATVDVCGVVDLGQGNAIARQGDEVEIAADIEEGVEEGRWVVEVIVISSGKLRAVSMF